MGGGLDLRHIDIVLVIIQFKLYEHGIFFEVTRLMNLFSDKTSQRFLIEMDQVVMVKLEGLFYEIGGALVHLLSIPLFQVEVRVLALCLLFLVLGLGLLSLPIKLKLRTAKTCRPGRRLLERFWTLFFDVFGLYRADHIREVFHSLYLLLDKVVIAYFTV